MFARLTYYILILPISLLPLPIIYLISDFFFLLLLTVIPYRKKVIEQNLRRSFPALPEKELQKIKRRFYRHFTDLLAEGIRGISMPASELQRRFIVKNPDVMDELNRKGRSVLLISGHYNNWEWLVTMPQLFPHKSYGIGKPLSSGFLNKKIFERRQRYGITIMDAGNYKEVLARNLHDLKAILVLSDQSPTNSTKSYWMEFLHQPTAVLFGAEMMANDLDYACVGYITRKIKRGYYEMELTLLTNTPKELPWGQLTEMHTRMLEQAIREKPEYWLWSHKRWKRLPPENLELLQREQREAYNKRFGKM